VKDTTEGGQVGPEEINTRQNQNKNDTKPWTQWSEGRAGHTQKVGQGWAISNDTRWCVVQYCYWNYEIPKWCTQVSLTTTLTMTSSTTEWVTILQFTLQLQVICDCLKPQVRKCKWEKLTAGAGNKRYTCVGLKWKVRLCGTGVQGEVVCLFNTITNYSHTLELNWMKYFQHGTNKKQAKRKPKSTKQMWSFEFHKLNGWHKKVNGTLTRQLKPQTPSKKHFGTVENETDRMTGNRWKIKSEELGTKLGEEHTISMHAHGGKRPRTDTTARNRNQPTQSTRRNMMVCSK